MAEKWVVLSVALLSPLFLLALLAILARRRAGLLPRLYPWITALCWVLWFSYLVLLLGNLLTMPSNNSYLKLLFVVWPFYFGFMLIKNWIGRRVDPEAYAKKPDGWWPSPKPR
jgi:hypothetical protein